MAAVAVTGEGIKELVNTITEITKNPDRNISKIAKMDDDDKWAFIGQILSKVQKLNTAIHPYLKD